MQCSTCLSHNHLSGPGQAYQCWCCNENHWVSEESLMEYRSLTDCTLQQAMQDLEDSIPWFCEAVMEPI